MKRATSKDVAKLAGVSQTTVSFVINNTPGVSLSEETRRKVLDAAKQLQYILCKGAENKPVQALGGFSPYNEQPVLSYANAVH